MSGTEIISSMVSGLVGAICGSLITAWLQNRINKNIENRKAIKDYLRIINKIIIANDTDDFSEHENLVEQEFEHRMNIVYLLEKMDVTLSSAIKGAMILFDTRRFDYLEAYDREDFELINQEAYYSFENKKIKFAKSITDINAVLVKIIK